MRGAEPPSVERVSRPSGDVEIERHPAYGMVAVSHPSGRTRLFGSKFEHQHSVMVRVSVAEAVRSPHMHTTDYYPKQRLLEIEMTETQWASLLSRPGSLGQPCTLRFVAGERPPEIELVESTADQLKRETDERMAATVAAVRDVAEALAETDMRQKDRRRLADLMCRLENALTHNVTFTRERIHEEIAEVVEHAKTEVEAHVAEAVRRAGLRQLTEGVDGPR